MICLKFREKTVLLVILQKGYKSRNSDTFYSFCEPILELIINSFVFNFLICLSLSSNGFHIYFEDLLHKITDNLRVIFDETVE